MRNRRIVCILILMLLTMGTYFAIYSIYFRQQYVDGYYSFHPHSDTIWRVESSKTHETIASVSADGVLILWDPPYKSCRQRIRISHSALYSCAFSPADDFLAVG